MKKMLRVVHRNFSALFFDPVLLMKRWKGISFYLLNAYRYNKQNTSAQFGLSVREAFYHTYDRFLSAGQARGHYFYQDLWAADWLRRHSVEHHVDVGSRIDGFIAHILPFCNVCYVDLRPIAFQWDGFEFRQGSILDLPFPDSSIASMSCLHVIEHIGLGRYGDPVDPKGYEKAAKELARVVKPGGHLLVSTPVGRERVCFDAHRVFAPQTIVDVFASLKLKSFALIDDAGSGIIRDASFEQAAACDYGCGLFVFAKSEHNT